jgi:hypothetical protein
MRRAIVSHFYYLKIMVTAGSFLTLTSCLESPCSNETINEVTSRDSQYVATIFKRDCGATTSFAQVVMIRKQGSPFRGDDKDEYVFTMEGLLKLKVYWKDASHLHIEPPDQNAIFIQRDSWKDVKISYGR